MTALLEKAILEIEPLSTDSQDVIAEPILADLTEERAWEMRFAKTSDQQWDKLAQMVRQEILAGETVPLDDFFQFGE